MISNLKLASLRPCGTKYYTVKDDNGLSIRVYPNGRKLWVVKKMVNGKNVFKQLGEYPAVSLADARRQRDALLQISEHADTEEFKNLTFAKIFEEWINLKATKIKDHKRVRRAFELHLLPAFGECIFTDVKPVMVRSHLLKMAQATNKIDTARRLCSWLGQMERFALGMGYIEMLKFQALIELMPEAQKGQQPSVSPSKLCDVMPILMRACIGSAQMWQIVQTGFYTLLRPGELVALKWAWIDDGVIEVPAEIMKMKKPHRVPITRQLQTVLDSCARVSEFVFPAPRSLQQNIRIESVEKTFSRNGLKGILVPHGVRSIGRTWMAEEGVDHQVAEACLAHRIGGAVELAYNRSDLLERRREVMQRWADFVESVIKGVA